MSTRLLFACGVAVFLITVIATLLYGYHAFRRMYAVSLSNVGVRPELYVRPESTQISASLSSVPLDGPL